MAQTPSLFQIEPEIQAENIRNNENEETDVDGIFRDDSNEVYTDESLSEQQFSKDSKSSENEEEFGHAPVKSVTSFLGRNGNLCTTEDLVRHRQTRKDNLELHLAEPKREAGTVQYARQFEICYS